MKKLKLMIVVGTRPEIIRLSEVIKRAQRYFELTIVHTGQNYDNNLSGIFFEDLGIPEPDIYLNCAISSPLESIGDMLIKIESPIITINPDAFLVLGDTNSCLTAIAAKKYHIPIFHMEAGNRCFDIRVPEETNRKIVDVISDINLTYSKISRDYLVGEGFPAQRIVTTGSPMREVIDANITKAQSSEVIRELSLSKNKYFLISVHRQENVDPPERLKEILNILIKISEQFNQKILVSLHPRTKKRIKDITDISLPENIIFHEPFSYSDYLQLQLNARVTISDSGTISEESSILNFPAINLRDTHERPEAMEEAAVMMTGINLERILNAIHMLELAGQDQSLEMQIPLDYQSRNVSEKVCRIILSYTDYIKKYIWLE